MSPLRERHLIAMSESIADPTPEPYPEHEPYPKQGPHAEHEPEPPQSYAEPLPDMDDAMEDCVKDLRITTRNLNTDVRQRGLSQAAFLRRYASSGKLAQLERALVQLRTSSVDDDTKQAMLADLDDALDYLIDSITESSASQRLINQGQVRNEQSAGASESYPVALNFETRAELSNHKDEVHGESSSSRYADTATTTANSSERKLYVDVICLSLLTVRSLDPLPV